MTKTRKLLSIVTAFLFTAVTCLSILPVQAMAKKTVLPKINLISGPKAQYEAGERITIKVNAPNYKGNVQYRVILWDGNKRAQKDLWPSMPGYYYKNWIPKGPSTFTIGWSITEPGPYSVTILVKRAGSKSKYDSYVKTNSFVVKAKEEAKEVKLEKAGETYGPQDSTKVETVNKDIYIKADKVTLRNLNVIGNVIVDPGKDGTAELDNVTAKTIKVLSGAQNSIHLKDVKAEKVEADSKDSKVRIKIMGSTEIGSTEISESTILENADGTFGKIVINKNAEGKYEVELIGKFPDTIVVKGDVILKAAENSEIAKVEIAPEDKNTIVTLDGSFGEIAVKNESKVVVADGSTVKNMEVNAKAEITVEKGAVVETLDKNNNEVNLDNQGTIKNEENTGSGGTTGGTTGGGTVIPPTEVTTENTNLNAAVNTVIDDMMSYPTAQKVIASIDRLPVSGKSNAINVTFNSTYKSLPMSSLVMLAREKMISHGTLTSDKDKKSLTDLSALLTNTKITAAGFPEGNLNSYIAAKVSTHPTLSAFFNNMSADNYNNLLGILTSDATKDNYDEYTEIAAILQQLIPGGDVTIDKVVSYGLTVKSIQLNSTSIYNESDKAVSIEEIKSALGVGSGSIGDANITNLTKIIVVLKGASNTEYTYTVNFN